MFPSHSLISSRWRRKSYLEILRLSLLPCAVILLGMLLNPQPDNRSPLSPLLQQLKVNHGSLFGVPALGLAFGAYLSLLCLSLNIYGGRDHCSLKNP